MMTLIQRLCVTALLCSAALCQPVDETRVETVTDYDTGLAQCGNAINCEIHYDNETELYYPDFKPGMGPGSAWFTENVEPFDTYWEAFDEMDNDDSDETEDPTVTAPDELASNTTVALSERCPPKEKRDHHHHHHHKLPHEVFHIARRTKQTTQYGGFDPAHILGVANKICHNTACNGAHKTYQTGYADGSNLIRGKLTISAKGSFNPRRDNHNKIHFTRGYYVKALQEIAHKLHKVHHHVGYKECTLICGQEVCEPKHVGTQYTGGKAHFIQRFIFPKGAKQPKFVGHLSISAVFKAFKDDACQQIVEELGIVAGAKGPIESIGAGYFGELSKLFC